MSTYVGELTNMGLTKAINDIKRSFPSLENGFYEVLIEMIKSENICDERLKDAVNHVVKTCIYPQPTIAQFLSYGKDVDLFDYDQIISMIDKDKNVFSKYTPVRFPDVKHLLWVSKKDVERYNLKV